MTRPPAGRRRPRINGLTLDDHRVLGESLRALRVELASGLRHADPGRPRVKRLALAMTGPLEALQLETEARVGDERPAEPAGLYVPTFGQPTAAAVPSVVGGDGEQTR